MRKKEETSVKTDERKPKRSEDWTTEELKEEAAYQLYLYCLKRLSR